MPTFWRTPRQDPALGLPGVVTTYLPPRVVPTPDPNYDSVCAIRVVMNDESRVHMDSNKFRGRNNMNFVKSMSSRTYVS